MSLLDELVQLKKITKTQAVELERKIKSSEKREEEIILEKNLVSEDFLFDLKSKKLKIPIVAIVDTNSDPTQIQYPIPANDDAVGSIKLITAYLTDAWIEGASQKQEQEEKDAKTEAEKAAKPAVEKKEVKPKKEVVKVKKQKPPKKKAKKASS